MPKSSKSPSFSQINFVCLGNICRSPLAHTIMEKKLEKRNLSSQFIVNSSGLGSWHIGKPSDKRMRETAMTHGYVINHRAQQFQFQDGENYDYIFAMDGSVYEGICNIVSYKHQKKVLMFRKFDLQNPNGDVPDPYYGGIRGFEEVFKMVEENCEHIITKLLLIEKNKN